MKKKYVSLLILILVLFTGCGPSEGGAPMRRIIRDFNQKGVRQTAAWDKHFSCIRARINEGDRDMTAFLDTLRMLEDYEAKHPRNNRFAIRKRMYEAKCRLYYRDSTQEYWRGLVTDAISRASIIGDKRLDAELAGTMADISLGDNYNMAYYSAKALELQEELGIDSFFYTQNRYFGISSSLNRIDDFKGSLKYGKGFLKRYEAEPERRFPVLLISQLDIIGQDYKALFKYDSLRITYQMLKDTLNSCLTGPMAEMRPLWEGVANGNIGLYYAYKQDYEKAKPLLDNYLEASRQFRDTVNIITALDNLCYYHRRRDEDQTALNICREALSLARQIKNHDLILKLMTPMGVLFKSVGQNDSSKYYIIQSLSHRIAKNKRDADMELSALHNEMSIEELQKNLTFTKNKYDRYKLIYHTLAVAILMFASFLYLIASQRKMKQKAEIESLKREFKIMQKQQEEARIRLDTLAHLKDFRLVTTESADYFRHHFNEAYPDFYDKLHKELGNSYTSGQERLASLVFLKLSNSEIADALGISAESVSRNKRRLRAALNLDEGINLEDYFSGYMEPLKDK